MNIEEFTEAVTFGSLQKIIDECHDCAVSKGWHDTPEGQPPRTFGDMMALAHSEISEAMEAFREYKGNPYQAMQTIDYDYTKGERGKPLGVAVELADVLIRIFDTAAHLGIPLVEGLEAKMAYNRTRPHRHGGKNL